jgi:hypothetical protein
MESGVEFAAVDNPHANKLTIHILAAVAEHEREAISERTKAALAAAKARGKRLGTPDPADGRRQHQSLHRRQSLHLAFQLDQLLLQMRCLRRQLFRWLLPVGGVKLRKIARHALLQLGAAPLYLPAREVLVAGIDRFELAAIDRNTRLCEQTHHAA